MKTIIATIAIAAASIGAAQAKGLTGTSADFGAAVAADQGARVINVDANTKYVNVENGETVQFNVQGHSFTWHFETFHDEAAFKLAKIAPQDVMPGSVEVYVAANPLYR